MRRGIRASENLLRLAGVATGGEHDDERSDASDCDGDRRAVRGRGGAASEIARASGGGVGPEGGGSGGA